MAMVGAFLGPVNGFMACLFTLVAGASLASLCLGVAESRFAPTQHGRLERVDSLEPARRSHALDKIPYATAIALGAAAAVLQPTG